MNFICRIYSTKGPFTKAFKRCGQYNDMQGRENHLVKVQGVPGYEVPAKDSARLVDPLKAPKKKKQKSSA